MSKQITTLLEQSAPEAARRLLGSLLVRRVEGETIIAKIVETEAYDQTDAASHSYKGKTPRSDVMFGPAGYLYVYFTYGMHYCCNVVTGKTGEGAAVLIRSVELLTGTSFAEKRRRKTGVDVTNGPAKLCQALAIDGTMNGHDLVEEPFQLIMQPALNDERIVQTPRIGISQARDIPWRFYVKNNRFVSN